MNRVTAVNSYITSVRAQDQDGAMGRGRTAGGPDLLEVYEECIYCTGLFQIRTDQTPWQTLNGRGHSLLPRPHTRLPERPEDFLPAALSPLRVPSITSRTTRTRTVSSSLKSTF